MIKVCLGEKVGLVGKGRPALLLKEQYLPIPCPLLPLLTEFTEVVTCYS